MRPRALTTLAVVAALLAAGCADRGDSDGNDGAAPPATTSAPTADFGDLKAVCGPGDPTGSPAQGVTDKEIRVGTMTDVGFTKNHEYVDAAKVFTAWCNEAGGINGRKIVSDSRDTKMMEARQRISESCREDFALVGGGNALDNLGVKDRVECLLPDFPAQVVKLENEGSALQFSVQLGGASYLRNAAFYDWLINEGYPQSKGAVGIIAGDTIKASSDQRVEFIQASGATMAYSDLYPGAGVSNWTPYAQAIKSKGVKGLIFMGDYRSLAKLEQELTNMNYKLDWIDPNVAAYGPTFLSEAGNQALTFQNNLTDLGGFAEPDPASTNPSVKKLMELYAKYAPDADPTLGTVKAFSSWLLFAKAASACGNDLTRKCLYDQALKETSWTGGGLQAPRDMSAQDTPQTCYNVVKATPEGWQTADFKPNQGEYRCGGKEHKLIGSYGRPVRLEDVGKSLADLK
ncbi:ABC transporter substrate-binding protein [Yinghuangia sp. ASG 101]|uniref:ABC transporter substrate-binding protein n=1 Tax=Yinghuangia sp. ASG 101 TaxID=2896848 RepID=UPI001E63BDBB|nr:ABC transporter substrate-binding protein [Yinghuangia sp. ASG 101]UGQ12207.1 ABC transporter substrate-binding protein [Yinghuangia sp. ASG 101]